MTARKPAAPLTTQQAADALGISRRRVQQMIADGLLKATPHANTFIIHPADLATAKRNRRGPGRPRKHPPR